MKKNITYYILLVTTLIFTSCDVLDLAPQDSFAEGNFWKNEAQVKGYISGMHTQLRSNATNFFRMGEVRGGQLSSISTFGIGMNDVSIIQHNLKESSPGINDWGGFYGNILQLNVLIDRLDKGMPFLTKEKNSYYLGQAHGLRAWYYFYLLRTWGGVPLITEPKVTQGTTNPTDLYTPRSPEADIMNFLKTEITASESSFAADDFTISAKRDLWSKAATLMLKADIYLWSAKVYGGTDKGKDLETAMNALKAIQTQSSKYALMDNFGDVFAYNNKGNKEIIMALHYEKGEAESNMRDFMYDIPLMSSCFDRNGNPMGNPLNVGDKTNLKYEYKWSLYESYSDKDARKDLTFMDFYVDKAGAKHGVVMRKFLGMVDGTTNIRYYSDDMPLYRYGELVLMMAEIKNAQGVDPSNEINAIRKRACGEGNYDVYTNKSFAENELAILQERDKELVCEGKRWFDVRRMQDASGKPLAFTESGLKESESYKLLWPINTGLITNDSSLEQTPGYKRGE